MRVLNNLRKRVYAEAWTPGKRPSEDEQLLRYIEDLIEENNRLSRWQSDKMWEADQISTTRMGL